MTNSKSSFLKDGFWIKAQGGILTIGSLAEENSCAKVLSPELSAVIRGMEEEMVEAIYGNTAVKFIAGKNQVDFSRLLKNMAGKYRSGNIKIIAKCPETLLAASSYECIIGLLKEFIDDSINYEFKNYAPGHIIMDVSELSGNLCILYRDNGKGTGKERLGHHIDFIRNKLNGELSCNSTPKVGRYYDIVIPLDMNKQEEID